MSNILRLDKITLTSMERKQRGSVEEKFTETANL